MYRRRIMRYENTRQGKKNHHYYSIYTTKVNVEKRFGLLFLSSFFLWSPPCFSHTYAHVLFIFPYEYIGP